ncbi:hypothetical protein [Paraburkholderia youngii]|uniref:hypothetical protein n=1 Tax=Paraburkholderia youngii TaxID=2782701 RepID=UPI003D212756
MESAYDYYVALAQSLQMTKEARDEAAAALQKCASDQQSAANLLTILKTSQADYACARQYVQGYQKSQDRGIQVSAAGVSVALTSLQSLGHSVEERITDILDGKGANETEGARRTYCKLEYAV